MNVYPTIWHLRRESFDELRQRTPLAPGEVADWLGRQPGAARAWRVNMPHYVREALILRGGCLEAIGPVWKGFFIHGEYIWTPCGNHFRFCELEGLQTYFALLHALAPRTYGALHRNRPEMDAGRVLHGKQLQHQVTTSAKDCAATSG
ncbi:MAG: hypothetical protein KGZ83_21530 [Sulfuricella sp.]|nr:hypothetical protein [Sulfuricella sp.]